MAGDTTAGMIGGMADPTPEALRDLACRLAEECGDIARDRLGRASVSTKADQSIVTDADLAAQSHILDALADTFPDHAVRAEETIRKPQRHADIRQARFCWVIDPIDGTRNYAAKFPCYSTSIAVLDAGKPYVGVIKEHNTGQLFAAIKGGGATCDGHPLQLKTPQTGGDHMVGVESSKHPFTVSVLQEWVATPGLVLRNLGSTAMHLALVAAGALDAAFCKRAKIWDVAAGALLVTEAGGLFTDLSGQPRPELPLQSDPSTDVPYLAGRSDVHERLCASIRGAVASGDPSWKQILR